MTPATVTTRTSIAQTSAGTPPRRRSAESRSHSCAEQSAKSHGSPWKRLSTIDSAKPGQVLVELYHAPPPGISGLSRALHALSEGLQVHGRVMGRFHGWRA